MSEQESGNCYQIKTLDQQSFESTHSPPLNKSQVEFFKDILVHVQNFSIFSISFISFISCLYYNYNTSSEGMKLFGNLMPMVGIHATVDFFITKKIDIQIHHVCVLGVLFYNYYNNVASEISIMLIYPFIKTEISSIFLSLKDYLPKKSIWCTVNSALFYVSFFKLRILDFYSEIIYNHESLNILIQKYSSNNPILSAIMISSCYGLYILNIYWFLIINKILYKSLSKLYVGINTDKICHFLCSYTYFINIPVCFFIYSYNKSEKNLYDVIGISSLSVASFLYHHDIYKRISENKITEYVIPDKNNVTLFLNDCAFINLRSFLTVFTSYYDHNYFIPIIIISSVFHFTSFYQTILNLFKLFIHADDVEMKNNFVNMHNIITIIPVACDILFVFINSNNEIGVPFLTVNIIMALLFMVVPFYKLNHFAFHVLLIVQNYYLCLSHNNGGVTNI